MDFMNEQTIIQAIENHRLLEFEYHDRLRLVEPHILGICNGVAQLLAYQIADESQSGGLPEWRRFDVEKMQSLKITRYVFEGSRDGERHADFQLGCLHRGSAVKLNILSNKTGESYGHRLG
jgi:predicted DNA-binding transcriptional regulator YafY